MITIIFYRTTLIYICFERLEDYYEKAETVALRFPKKTPRKLGWDKHSIVIHT